MPDSKRLARFEQTVMPHFGPAYNLARWLAGSDADAADIVQESYLRALTFFDGFRGGDARAWLFSIVRNTCYTWLQKNRRHELIGELDEELLSPAGISDPEIEHLRRCDAETVRRHLERLPAEFRETLVLREMEGLSYREISEITGVAIGTVMSRLARARRKLQESLAAAGAQRESHA